MIVSRDDCTNEPKKVFCNTNFIIATWIFLSASSMSNMAQAETDAHEQDSEILRQLKAHCEAFWSDGWRERVGEPADSRGGLDYWETSRDFCQRIENLSEEQIEAPAWDEAVMSAKAFNRYVAWLIDIEEIELADVALDFAMRRHLSAPLFLQRSQRSIRNGQNDDAVKDILTAYNLEQWPRRLTITRLSEAGAYDKAIELANEFFEQRDRMERNWQYSGAYRERASYLLLRASLYEKKNEFQLALDDFSEAYKYEKLAETYPQSLLSRADFNLSRGEPGLAKEDLTQYITDLPLNHYGYHKRCRVNFELGKYFDAQADCDTAIDYAIQKPENAKFAPFLYDEGKSNYYYWSAKVAFARNDIDMTRSRLNKGLEIYPENRDIQDLMAELPN